MSAHKGGASTSFTDTNIIMTAVEAAIPLDRTPFYTGHSPVELPNIASPQSGTAGAEIDCLF